MGRMPCRRWKLLVAGVIAGNTLLIVYLLLAYHRDSSGIDSPDAIAINRVAFAHRHSEERSVLDDAPSSFTAAVKRQLTHRTLPRVDELSCAKLLAGEPSQQQGALALSQARPVPLDYRNDDYYAAQTCSSIRQRFITESLSDEEASFPVAFSLIVFKDFYQVEKLFRAVYRPEHFYCFHVDSKADRVFHRAVVQHASCFDNVAMTERRVDIRWGRFTVLEADLLCMQKLLAMSGAWRYFINLTGQEFPLRSMRELVRILRALRGANNMENAGPRDGAVRPLEVALKDGSKVPIRWYKGSVHVTATRGFVEFALSDTGRQISEHLRQYGRWPCPDEVFFATLNHNPSLLKAPGADKTGLLTDNIRQPFLNRYKNWIFGLFGYPCRSGKIVRQICVWGIQDLPAMDKRPELFVNKFYFNFQRFGLQCMEERFWNSTLADYGVPGYRKTHEIRVEFYSKFEFVRNHL